MYRCFLLVADVFFFKVEYQMVFAAVPSDSDFSSSRSQMCPLTFVEQATAIATSLFSLCRLWTFKQEARLSMLPAQ